jgi:hypothetical protein
VRILKIIGVGSLCIIGLVIFAIIMALGTLFTCFYLQMVLFGRGDYLLFVSSMLYKIPVNMIMILIMYAFIKKIEKFLKSKEKQTEIIEEDNDPAAFGAFTKIFKVIKICYIPVLIIVLYCGMTSYGILYTESIKVCSPIKPTGVVYKYSDVKSIDVGVEKDDRNSFSPYYNVIFDDGKSLNLIGGVSMHEDRRGFEYILIDLDKKLRAQGVSKRVNKVNFEEYSKGLDKDFISRVEKLFDEK